MIGRLPVEAEPFVWPWSMSLATLNTIEDLDVVDVWWGKVEHVKVWDGI